jgi:sporulation-control protein
MTINISELIIKIVFSGYIGYWLEKKRLRKELFETGKQIALNIFIVMFLFFLSAELTVFLSIFDRANYAPPGWYYLIPFGIFYSLGLLFYLIKNGRAKAKARDRKNPIVIPIETTAKLLGKELAQIKTQIEKELIYPGGKLTGEIHVHGGQKEQKIDNIYLKIYTHPSNDSSEKIEVTTYRMVKSFTIQPNESHTFPIECVLPYDTPLSSQESKLWIHTLIEIDQVLFTCDQTELNVDPHPDVQKILDSLSVVGYTLKRTECTYDPDQQTFEQKLTYIPINSDLDQGELEICYRQSTAHGVELFLNIDQRKRADPPSDYSPLTVTFGPMELNQSKEHYAAKIKEALDSAHQKIK